MSCTVLVAVQLTVYIVLYCNIYIVIFFFGFNSYFTENTNCLNYEDHCWQDIINVNRTSYKVSVNEIGDLQNTKLELDVTN